MELFERLRAEGRIPAWPVVFLTGHGDVPMAVEALKQGAFDFVEKPFNDNSLVDRLVAALEESRRRLAEARRRRPARASGSPRSPPASAKCWTSSSRGTTTR